jgi:protein-tyrosine phosphatase
MHFELTGTRNFRSLKGLPTVDGRCIADHAILRSDQLDLLVAQDWEILTSLGVKTVCDLRSSNERLRYPNNLPIQGLRQVDMDVISDVRADPILAAAMKSSPDAQGAANLMLEVYRRLPASLSPHLPALFGLFASGGVPVLIHCAAGKDRTGFAVAVLLHALGVTPEAILADYLLSARLECVSNPVRREMVGDIVSRLAGDGQNEAMIDAIMDARTEYLETAFAAVAAQYGSMDAYIQICGGLDAGALQQLRTRWLTSAV